MMIREIPDLPLEFVEALEKKGYQTLYPPQKDAIDVGVLQGKNLLLATPTASGKTLVAIMAAIRAIERGGKVVYLAPLRALASEKYDEFKEIFDEIKKPGKQRSKIRVFISTGDFDSSGESLGGADVIILTNERFDSVIRHGASWLESVTLFIADEVHLVGEPHRGPTLEMILAKVMNYVPSARFGPQCNRHQHRRSCKMAQRHARRNQLEACQTGGRNLRLRKDCLREWGGKETHSVQQGSTDRCSSRCRQGRRPISDFL